MVHRINKHNYWNYLANWVRMILLYGVMSHLLHPRNHKVTTNNSNNTNLTPTHTSWFKARNKLQMLPKGQDLNSFQLIWKLKIELHIGDLWLRQAKIKSQTIVILIQSICCTSLNFVNMRMNRVKSVNLISLIQNLIRCRAKTSLYKIKRTRCILK